MVKKSISTSLLVPEQKSTTIGSCKRLFFAAQYIVVIFDCGIWYLVGCLYGISIVNSAQSTIIVVIGIFDQVIAFGLHQSQHLVEVREKALFEVRSHLNNSNNSQLKHLLVKAGVMLKKSQPAHFVSEYNRQVDNRNNNLCVSVNCPRSPFLNIWIIRTTGRSLARKSFPNLQSPLCTLVLC